MRRWRISRQRSESIRVDVLVHHALAAQNSTDRVVNFFGFRAHEMMIGISDFRADAAQFQDLCVAAKLASNVRHLPLDGSIYREPEDDKIEVSRLQSISCLP